MTGPPEPGDERMSPREAVYSALSAIVGRRGAAIAISDDTPLFERGARLDSLDFAELVARLEDDLGIDPFARSWTPRTLDTVLRLVEVYEQAMG